MALCLSFPINLLWDNSEMILMKSLPEMTSSGTKHLPCGFCMSQFLAYCSVQTRLIILVLQRLKPEDRKCEDHPAAYQV